MSLDSTVHNNWNTRPADERFSSLPSMHDAAAEDKRIAKILECKLDSLRVRADGQNLVLVGSSGAEIEPSNFAFGQLCGHASAPASYLSTLPAELAAQCLNNGLVSAGDKDVRLLAAINGRRVLRGIRSPGFSQLWDADMLKMIMDRIAGTDWINPDCYTFNAETGRPNWGGEMAPGGLYRGDRDMIGLLINKTIQVEVAPGDFLHPYVTFQQSEVYGGAVKFRRGLVRHFCGNLMGHGARDIEDHARRHVGNVTDWTAAMIAMLFDGVEQQCEEDAEMLRASRDVLLGTEQASVVASVVKATKLPVKTATAAYKLAEEWQSVDGSPLSAWGQSNGLTRYAQLSQWADSAETINAAAGQLLRVTVRRLS